MEISNYGHLWEEWKELKTEDVLTQTQRQQLRANNHELRHLERHLQLAVANKELSEQLRNAAQLKERNLLKKREENAKLAAERELVCKLFQKQEEKEKLNKKILLELFNFERYNAHQKKRKDFEDAYKDRDRIEKVMKQTQAEEFAKLKKDEMFREKCKEEMDEHYKAIRMRKQLEKERAIEENKLNVAYQEECNRTKSEKEIERKRITEEMESIRKLLDQQLTSINWEKEERERLLLSLSMQECREKELRDFKKGLIKVADNIQKFEIEFNSNSSERNTRREIEFKEEEEKFRIQSMRYMKERDKLWQLSEEKRRRKIMDHNRELIEIIEQRRSRKANEFANKILEFENLKTDKEKGDLFVAQERALLLDSVPKDLLRYLPAGVLKPSEISRFCKT